MKLNLDLLLYIHYELSKGILFLVTWHSKSGVQLADEAISKGKYPAFDGAVFYRKGDDYILAIFEMRFTSKMNEIDEIEPYKPS
jgi:hypothetical protein